MSGLSVDDGRSVDEEEEGWGDDTGADDDAGIEDDDAGIEDDEGIDDGTTAGTSSSKSNSFSPSPDVTAATAGTDSGSALSGSDDSALANETSTPLIRNVLLHFHVAVVVEHVPYLRLR